MHVLFTHSYFLRFDSKQWAQMRPYAPLGTIQAAAVIRQSGYTVSLHDVMFAETPASISPVLQHTKPGIVVIYDDGFNYLTKMCLTAMRNAAFEMAREAKKHNCTVIVCSSDANDHYDKYLANGADFVIAGEGEQTLEELINALANGAGAFDTIAGIIYRHNGVTRRTIARPVMHHLDALPLPAWDLIDMTRYRNAWLGSEGRFSVNISTTRGCPFKCNWCAKPIYGNRYNIRTPEHVVQELKMLQQQYGFDHVWFADDIFGLKPGWVKRFAALVKENNLSFHFKIQSRADLLLNDEQVASLAAAGCETVWLGAESGSQKILDAMDKGITTQQIANATQLLHAHGIKVAFFLQFGYPGETLEDIRQTVGMVKKLMPDDIGISVSYPLPGTKFYNNVREQLQQKTNWVDSNDMDMMFTGTYSREFYKMLHHYVHACFRKWKAQAALSQTLKNIARVPWYLAQEKWYQTMMNKDKLPRRAAL